MSIQDVPRCFQCGEPIETGVVFEAPCGHLGCATACFHGLCLMEWREYRQDWEAAIEKMRKTYIEEHTGNEPERN